MVKRHFFLCFLAFVYSAGLCEAAPGYGTEMPRKGKLHLGGQTYSVQRRDLEGDNGELSSLQHFLLLSYGITDWFSLDFKGGAGDTHLKFYDKEFTRAVFGFQHISVHPYSVFVGNVKHKAVIDDWPLSWFLRISNM